MVSLSTPPRRVPFMLPLARVASRPLGFIALLLWVVFGTVFLASVVRTDDVFRKWRKARALSSETAQVVGIVDMVHNTRRRSRRNRYQFTYEIDGKKFSDSSYGGPTVFARGQEVKVTYSKEFPKYSKIEGTSIWAGSFFNFLIGIALYLVILVGWFVAWCSYRAEVYFFRNGEIGDFQFTGLAAKTNTTVDGQAIHRFSFETRVDGKTYRTNSFGPLDEKPEPKESRPGLFVKGKPNSVGYMLEDKLADCINEHGEWVGLRYPNSVIALLAILALLAGGLAWAGALVGLFFKIFYS